MASPTPDPLPQPDPIDAIADGGPEFDPGAPPAGDPLPGVADALAGGETWSTQRVRGLLTAKGELLHAAIALDKRPDSTEWRYTEADLATIAAPLARILNRYEPTRAAAAAGDELTVAVGFLGYGMRSYSERRRALHAMAAEPDPEPVEYSAAAAAAQAASEPASPEAGPPVPPIAPRRL